MKYLYYPGCSLEGTASEYDLSVRGLMAALDVDLVEIDDWTCCGASAAEAVSRLLALVLPARNLALAEKMDSKLEMLVPCSACYLNLKRVTEKIKSNPDLHQQINDLLADDSLHLKGSINVRHILDILCHDIGPEAIGRRVTKPLHGLQVAPYYGCQCLRPYPVFDDPEFPRSMEALIQSTGASVFPWSMGGKCCGASHMNTKPEVGIRLISGILHAACKADVIITVCPMCQMNLEAYQNRIQQQSESFQHLTILYLPQLLGLALGLPQDVLGLDLNLSITARFREKQSA